MVARTYEEKIAVCRTRNKPLAIVASSFGRSRGLSLAVDRTHITISWVAQSDIRRKFSRPRVSRIVTVKLLLPSRQSSR